MFSLFFYWKLGLYYSSSFRFLDLMHPFLCFPFYACQNIHPLCNPYILHPYGHMEDISPEQIVWWPCAPMVRAHVLTYLQQSSNKLSQRIKPQSGMKEYIERYIRIYNDMPMDALRSEVWHVTWEKQTDNNRTLTEMFKIARTWTEVFWKICFAMMSVGR